MEILQNQVMCPTQAPNKWVGNTVTRRATIEAAPAPPTAG